MQIIDLTPEDDDRIHQCADLMVEGGLRDDARTMLQTLRDEEVPPVGKQACQLELGRLGSDQDLVDAMKGPDRALASLARMLRATRVAVVPRADGYSTEEDA